MTRLCFVSSRQGNHFMTELLAGVASVAADEGVSVSLVFDAFPPADPRTVYVVIPHEFFAVIPPEGWPSLRQLRSTIAFCVEMPGTLWFDLTATYAAHAGAAVAISRSAVFELRRRGVPAEHFQLGYCREWDTWHGDPAEPRPIDVLYMASADARRARFLAGFARGLWRWRSSILVPPVAPKTGPRPDYLTGAEKYGRMRSSKVLLNLHRGDSRSLEWVRVLEAICNGCVVLSEHSPDHEPLVPGAHFVSASPENLGFLADHLLEDPDRLATMRHAAYEFVRTDLPMGPAVARLLAIADGIVAQCGSVREAAAPTGARLPSPSPPIPAATGPLSDGAVDERDRIWSALNRLTVQNAETRRLVGALLPSGGGWDLEGVREVASTAAFALAGPRVTVAVPLYNHAREVAEALSSVAVSEYVDFDVLVYDDASTDRSAQVAERFLADHPWLPACLLQGRVNGGPARARNVLATRARGDLLFFLDADSEIYPSALGRLVEALAGNPDAMFAYSILSMHTHGVPSGLGSALPWEPERLRGGNYIEAMALIRRADLMAMGGLAEDARLQGWEDYDLWCRCADQGKRGVLVPEILGRSRTSDPSAARLHQVDSPAVTSLIRERSPSLFKSEGP